MPRTSETRSKRKPPTVADILERDFDARFLVDAPSGPPLTHYTTLRGLRGILSSGTYLAKHFSNASDPRELKLTDDLFLEYARQAFKRSPANSASEELAKLLQL